MTESAALTISGAWRVKDCVALISNDPRCLYRLTRAYLSKATNERCLFQDETRVMIVRGTDACDLRSNASSGFMYHAGF